MVAVDGSPESLQALKTVQKLAQEVDRVYLMHVIAPVDTGLPIHKKELKQAQLKNYKSLVETVEPFVDGIKAEYEWIQKYGPPPFTICNEIRERNINHLVLGDRGLGGFRRVLLGSLCNYCVHYAPCNVMIVKDKARSEEDWDKVSIKY
eukprot:TRINITY_DN3131_c0_g1_i2.p1 TRINITY_DN3131_c0_g1~~TRINITY_DN3131_c0_g1_i2.p1  ORF type:complete len:149 (-),score=24.61 TRINITY_DN3131_c0_g1_i2:15-461(-)